MKAMKEDNDAGPTCAHAAVSMRDSSNYYFINPVIVLP
jgi:hypothetical protein